MDNGIDAKSEYATDLVTLGMLQFINKSGGICAVADIAEEVTRPHSQKTREGNIPNPFHLYDDAADQHLQQLNTGGMIVLSEAGRVVMATLTNEGRAKLDSLKSEYPEEAKLVGGHVKHVNELPEAVVAIQKAILEKLGIQPHLSISSSAVTGEPLQKESADASQAMTKEKEKEKRQQAVEMAKAGILHLLDVRKQRVLRYQQLQAQLPEHPHVKRYLLDNHADNVMSGEKILQRLLSSHMAEYFLNPDADRNIHHLIANPYLIREETPRKIQSDKQGYAARVRALVNNDTAKADEEKERLSFGAQIIVEALDQLKEQHCITESYGGVTRRYDAHEQVKSTAPAYAINDIGMHFVPPEHARGDLAYEAARNWAQRVLVELSNQGRTSP